MTASKIRELARAKDAAVAREDYDEAKRIKAGIDRLKVGRGGWEAGRGGGRRGEVWKDAAPHGPKTRSKPRLSPPSPFLCRSLGRRSLSWRLASELPSRRRTTTPPSSSRWAQRAYITGGGGGLIREGEGFS